MYQISDSASNMVAERISLERLGLRLINLPLCPANDVTFIEDLIPRAKEGFSLSIKAGNFSRSELVDLRRFATPTNDPEAWTNMKLPEKLNTLPEYQHTIATLSMLIKTGRVSYFDFASPPKEITPDLMGVETFWNYNTTISNIWGIRQH